MLCHCITSANRARYVRQLETMFRQRHDVFVEGMGWRELRRPDRRDFDQYDTDDTVYLVVLDGGGEVFAHSRMNPTWGRHQLEDGSELKAQFAARTPPSGPTIWEGSRLVPGLPEKQGFVQAAAAMGLLLAGVQEFCVRRGITLGLSILEMRTLSRIQSLGWESEPLGLPVAYETDKGRAEAMAVTWKTGGSYLLQTRRRFGISGPVIFEAAPALGETEANGPTCELLEYAAEISTPLGQRAALDTLQSILEQEAAAALAARARARQVS